MATLVWLNCTVAKSSSQASPRYHVTLKETRHQRAKWHLRPLNLLPPRLLGPPLEQAWKGVLKQQWQLPGSVQVEELAPSSYGSGLALSWNHDRSFVHSPLLRQVDLSTLGSAWQWENFPPPTSLQALTHPDPGLGKGHWVTVKPRKAHATGMTLHPGEKTGLAWGTLLRSMGV